MKNATAKAKIAPNKEPSAAAALRALRRAIEREIVVSQETSVLKQKLKQSRKDAGEAQVRASYLESELGSLRSVTMRLCAEKDILHRRVLAQNEELRKERNDGERRDS